MNSKSANFYGKWQVNNRLFNDRREAILFASANNGASINWVWHNEVWDRYNKALLGKISLPELYRQRAQQLRDKYDYLILSYSGGADSHNVLMTFINNNIKLDQVFVHMPFNVINSTRHNPNTADKSARNLISEWDYVIKPSLDWLSQSHPEITIELKDWTENISEDIFTKDIDASLLNVSGIGFMARNMDFSLLGRTELDKGRSVATIHAAEKPIVINDNEKAYMMFSDRPSLIAVNNNLPVELFYWTPDLPELTYEMSYQVYLYFKANPHLQKFMWQRNMAIDFGATLSLTNSIAKTVCYSDTWDFRKFQAEKPVQHGVGKDRDWYVYELPEFKRAAESWKYHCTGIYDGADSKFLGIDEQTIKFRTKGFYLGDL
jgi:hypothetical protein